MRLRIIAAALAVIWLLLVLIGKSGIVHVLLLSAVIVLVVDLAESHRSRVKEQIPRSEKNKF